MSTNYISYSGFSTERKCPYSYWNKYVVKTTQVEPENGINALYGSSIGTLFEAFYRDRLWRDPKCAARLQDLAESHLDAAIDDTTKKGRVIDWLDEKANYHSKSEILKDLYETIPTGLQTIRQNRLVGPRMEPELKLDHKFGSYIMGGRSDFVIQRVPPYNDLVILDGKGSKHRDKYVDGQPLKKGEKAEGVQLKWYAVLYRARRRVIPDKLGYIFWRFSGELALEWIPFSEKDLDNLQAEVLSVIARIDKSVRKLEAIADTPQSHDELRQELFPAQPSHNCTLCSFVSICESGQKEIQKYRRRARLNLPEGVTELTLGSDD
jgi:hypothetical protein